MDIDIKDLAAETLKKAKEALLEMLSKDAPQVIEAVDSYIANGQDRLINLLEKVSQDGDIKFMLDRLAEEKDILYSEVLSFVVIGKQIIQDALNKVQDILLTAIGQALPPAV